MIRGVTFEIPNTYGSYLSNILEPLSASKPILVNRRTRNI